MHPVTSSQRAFSQSGTNPRYLFGLRGADRLSALDHVTPLYTALGDTVKKVVSESITSL